MPKLYKRGYPVAILIGVEANHAVLWQIFSHVVKLQQTIQLNNSRNDQKAAYNFHENIVNAIRPTLKQGIKSIIIVAPSKTSYAQELFAHLKTHHHWLFQGENKATIKQIAGSASTPSQVAALTKTNDFKESISQTTAHETDDLLEILEKRLSQTGNLVCFSLEEAENLIFPLQAPGKPAAEYLLLTNDYLLSNRQKNRIHRLMQIAQNKGVKTRVVDAESTAGKRLGQLGGIVCLAKA